MVRDFNTNLSIEMETEDINSIGMQKLEQHN